MTFDDDMMVLRFDGGTKFIPIKFAGMDWPPPEEFEIGGFKMKMSRRSQLTDDQRAGMTNVCRCAEYYPVREKEVGQNG